MGKKLNKNDIVHIYGDGTGKLSKLKRKHAVLYEIVFFLFTLIWLIFCLDSKFFIILALIYFFIGVHFHKLSKAPAINSNIYKQQTNYNSNVSIKKSPEVDISNIPEVTVDNFLEVTTVNIPEVKRPVIRNYDFKVVGVTFKTGRKSRQTALRKIYFHDEPYQKVNIKLEVYEFEGEEALGVFVNDFQVGNIAKKDIDKAIELLLDGYSISYTIYGGGQKNWGMTIRLSKQIQ